MSQTILIGAGAFARDMVDAFGQRAFAGIYVDPQFATKSFCDLPIFTRWEDVRQVASRYVLGVSDIGHRQGARLAAAQAGLTAAEPMVARTAVVAGDAHLAGGCAIGHMVMVGPSARLGQDTLIMHSAVVGHDTIIEDNTVLCAGVCVGGHAEIGARTFIGANAVLAPGIKLAADCYVAAGAACFRDAPAGSRWIGNPARRADR